MHTRLLPSLLAILTLAACSAPPSEPADDTPDASQDMGADPADTGTTTPDAGVEDAGSPEPDASTEPPPTTARCDEDHPRHVLEIGGSLDDSLRHDSLTFGDASGPGFPIEVEVPEGISAWAIIDWPRDLNDACVGGCDWIRPQVLDEECSPITGTIYSGGSSRLVEPTERLAVKSVRVDGSSEPRTLLVAAQNFPSEFYPIPFRVSLLTMVCYEDWPALEDGASGTLTQDDAPVFVQSSPASRRDAFTITLAEGEVSRWRLNTDVDIDTFDSVRIFSPSCEPIGGWSSFGDEEPIIEITATEAGDYTISVEGGPDGLGAGADFSFEKLP